MKAEERSAPTSDREAAIATDPSLDAPDGRPRSRADVPQALVLAAAWAWRIVLVIGAVLVIGWLLVRVRVVLIPVFVAILLTALLAPVVERLDRVMPRILATWLTLLLGFAALAGLAWLLQAPIRDAVDDLAASWETTRADIIDWLREGPLSLSESQVDTLQERVRSTGDSLVSGLYDEPRSDARRAIDVVTGVFLSVVLTFFFLKDGREMWRWFVRHLAPARRRSVEVGGRSAFSALQGWIRGVAITGVADAAFIGAALVILDVPAAIPLTVLTFFAAFFPIVGATVAGGLAALIALATQGPQTAIIVVIVTIAVQQIEGDVLLPIVMKRQVSLHPAVVLVALALGGAIGGIAGAIVSVPLTAASTAAVAAMRREGAGGEHVGGADEHADDGAADSDDGG